MAGCRDCGGSQDILEECLAFVRRMERELNLRNGGLCYRFLLNTWAWMAVCPSVNPSKAKPYEGMVFGHPCAWSDSPHLIQLSIHPKEETQS